MKKQFKPKIKEIVRKDAVIKVRTLIKQTQYPKGCYDNKELMTLVIIETSNRTSSTSFPLTKKGTRDLLNFIKQEIYLR